jgi:thiamine pyrophosphate-dependent acetolactate synthase large subunit-like protein
VDGIDVIASILRAEGTECLFCFPDNLLIEAAARLGIRPLVARSERAAVSMADGFARMTDGRRPAVVAVQYGPGIENSFGAVAQAYSDSSPILVLSGHLSAGRIGQPPTFDPVVNFREITKWAARITAPDRIEAMLRRAFIYLRTGRPGPVVLDVPTEVAVATGLADPTEHYIPCVSTRAAPDPDSVADAVRTLSAARLPVIHAGQGVLYAQASSELVQFAELVNAPVMTTLPGKSAFPEDHPLSLGAGGKTGLRLISHYLERSDLIFGIGSSLTETVFAAPLPPGKIAIQATIDERDLGKDYPLRHALLGDAKLVLRALSERWRTGDHASGATRENLTGEIAVLRDEIAREWRPHLESPEVPMSPYRVIAELTAALDSRQTVITHDSGLPRDQLAPFWPSLTPRSYLGWGKSTHLGYGLGLALGAKVADPTKTVVNVMGDSAIGMAGMELEVGARLRIPIITVIFNNGGMSFYERKYPVATERYGLKHLHGDYAALARALGVHGERVIEPDAIPAAIERALEATRAGQPALLEMMTKEEDTLADW